jgi:hypothetical protein
LAVLDGCRCASSMDHVKRSCPLTFFFQHNNSPSPAPGNLPAWKHTRFKR